MDKQQTRQGVLFALSAYSLWGMTPTYFKLLDGVPTMEILMHRIIWSFFFMLLTLTLSRSWSQVYNAYSSAKTVLLLAVTAICISSNWLLFIWAINHNHILEASLGYFINPMFNVLFGVIFLGERFSRLQWIAVILAFSGVMIQLWHFGSVPLAGLGLAVNLALYGLLRKKIVVEAQAGLFIETLWLLPAAALYLFVFADSPSSQLLVNSWQLNTLLVTAGVVSTVPLLFFTAAASRLRLSTLGLFQYLGPTLMLLLAVIFYDETISHDQMVTFGFIWTALFLFTLDAIHSERKLRLAGKENSTAA